jgi:hypothetical protein
MKLRFLSIAILLAAFSQFAVAQNTIKLFDAAKIVVSRTTSIKMFKSKRVSLSCPTSEPVRAVLTGPNGGPFAVDNSVTINREWVLGGATLSTGLSGDATSVAGSEMGAWYTGVDPVDVSDFLAAGDGVYEFELWDFGVTYGNTEIYLSTNCTAAKGRR